jgi:hypothetical protein
MKITTRIAITVLLVVIGTFVAAYSYTQLQGQDVLFDQNSIQLDGHSYLGYEIIAKLDGKFAPSVVGGVGSVGYGVDFFLVNETSWNSWSTNPGLRSILSTVHLNATAVSSQSVEGQFSFSPPVSAGYSAVFVNDEYPSANNASLHATITLQYMILNSLYAMMAGLVTLAIGFVLLILTTRRKVQR